MSERERYDVVVVGAGSAGCVVAARLSEDPSRRVLLVEAGADPDPLPDVIADPRRQPEVILDPAYVRHYPVTRADGSPYRLISGRLMGGGSAVNNLSVQRPIRRDYAAWQRFGGEAWSEAALVPILRSVEGDEDLGDRPDHGRGGPIRVVRPWRFDSPADPPVRGIVEAAMALGLPRCEDANAPEPFGIVEAPYMHVDGRRQTVAAAYLDPVRGRPNLGIAAETSARRVVVEGGRACAVELSGPDGSRRVGAGEVVLSTGAYGTPHLLLLSGVGTPSKLEPVGLEVVHRLDGVGENFHDHAVVNLAFAGGPELAADHRVPRLRLVAASDPALGYGDLHIMFRQPKPGPDGALRMSVSVRLLEHRGAGAIRLASADPEDLPRVEPAILEHPGDLAAMVRGIELATALATGAPARPFFGPRLVPPPGADLGEHARTSWITYNHGSGTCRIGPADDPLAVVGPDLRVHGLDGLTIADASVLPTIPHAATNLSAILVGEVAARNLR